MSFLLDADTCSAYIRGEPAVQNRFIQYGGRLHVSIITEIELKQWLWRKRTPKRYVAESVQLFASITILPIDDFVVREAGTTGASCLDRGVPMSLPDLIIASTALVQNITLVTHNTSDYGNVRGLRLADWIIP